LTEEETFASLADKPALCDPEVVKEQCQAMDLLDESGSTITIEELAEVVAVPFADLEKLFKEHVDVTMEGGKVACMQLCEALVRAVPESDLPPSSDVACRKTKSGTKICDVDVSPEELAQVEFSDIPDFHEGHPVLIKEPVPAGSLAQHAENDGVGLAPSELILRLVNMFRIYPLMRMKVDADVGDVAIGGDDFSLIESGQHCPSTCMSFRSCYEATECGGCSACRNTAVSSVLDMLDMEDPPWVADVEKVSVKAQAYVANAITKVKKSKTVMKRWFGADTGDEQRQVLKVLNSLTSMLHNVEYKKGDDCPERTYAYVFPEGEKAMNDAGEYIFYLCPFYFKATTQLKIETLTHEGSHHATAYTGDVCTDETCSTTAYGRKLCAKLAKEHPEWALENADNYCFYITDVNKKRRR